MKRDIVRRSGRWLATLLLWSGAALAQPVRLAAPGFNAVNFDPAMAAFYSEHFAQQLALRKLSVVTAAEISALIGLERQKQLLGCGEDSSSCLAELSGALGVDGVITGSIGKLGKTLQANIKIIRASNGTALSLVSRSATSEDDLFDALTGAADVAARDVLSRLRPGTEASLDTARAGLGPISYRVQRPNHVRIDLLSMISGAYAVEYERIFNPLFSLTVRPVAILYHANSFARGGELGLGGRLYPFGRAPHGLWLGPEVRGSYTAHLNATGFAFAVSGALGWTWASDTFPLTGSLGMAIGPYLTPHSPNDTLGLDIRMTGALGWSFF